MLDINRYKTAEDIINDSTIDLDDGETLYAIALKYKQENNNDKYEEYKNIAIAYGYEIEEIKIVETIKQNKKSYKEMSVKELYQEGKNGNIYATVLAYKVAEEQHSISKVDVYKFFYNTIVHIEKVGSTNEIIKVLNEIASWMKKNKISVLKSSSSEKEISILDIYEIEKELGDKTAARKIEKYRNWSNHIQSEQQKQNNSKQKIGICFHNSIYEMVSNGKSAKQIKKLIHSNKDFDIYSDHRIDKMIESCKKEKLKQKQLIKEHQNQKIFLEKQKVERTKQIERNKKAKENRIAEEIRQKKLQRKIEKQKNNQQVMITVILIVVALCVLALFKQYSYLFETYQQILVILGVVLLIGLALWNINKTIKN